MVREGGRGEGSEGVMEGGSEGGRERGGRGRLKPCPIQCMTARQTATHRHNGPCISDGEGGREGEGSEGVREGGSEGGREKVEAMPNTVHD